MRAKKNKKKLSDLDNFLESLAVSGDFARAAEPAGVSDEQLNQWFNARRTNRRNPQAHYDPDILSKIALARYKGQFRKNLRTPLMEPEQFAEALRYCYNCSTKRGSRNDTAIINLLIKNPRISNEDGARKLKIKLSAYKMRKRRLFEALFERLTIR